MSTLQSITTDYLSILDAEIKKIEFNPHPAELYEPIKYLLSLGGKRMRPVLLMMACDLFEGDISKSIPQALAIEIFHNFTLMHDDIMDEAPKRRNMPTVHKKWNENTAILSGDVMLVCAYQQLCKSDPQYLAQLLQLFNTTAVEVCEGQQLDMNYETRNDVSIEEYILMIELKTAVLLGCSLKTGAVIAHASVENQDKMYAFGKNIGIAFQLQDDLLDVFGNPDKFGKQVGGDILSNKKTYLFIKALELANATQKETLLHWFSVENFDPKEKVDAVVQLYNELNIKKITQEKMQYYFDISMQNMNEIDITSANKEPLIQFANQLMVRES